MIEEKQVRHLKGLQENSMEVQEILGRTPSWIYRWGISIVLFLTLSIILVCGSIHYPQVQRIELSLSYIDGPQSVKAKIDGTVAILQKQKGEHVISGDTIACIQNESGEVWAVSPSSGTIETHWVLSAGSTFHSQDILCWIIPDSTGDIVCHGKADARYMGRLSKGTAIRLEVVQDFQKEVRDGIISYVSRFPDKDGDLYFEVSLLDGEALPVGCSNVTCLVTMDNPSLLERVLEKLSGIVRRP